MWARQVRDAVGVVNIGLGVASDLRGVAEIERGVISGKAGRCQRLQGRGQIYGRGVVSDWWVDPPVGGA